MFSWIIGPIATDLSFSGDTRNLSVLWSVNEATLSRLSWRVTSEEAKGATAAGTVTKLAGQMRRDQQVACLTLIARIISRAMTRTDESSEDPGVDDLIPNEAYVSELPEATLQKYTGRLRVKSDTRMAITTGVPISKGEAAAVLACSALTEWCLTEGSAPLRRSFLIGIGIPVKGLSAGLSIAGSEAAQVAAYVAQAALYGEEI